MAAAVGPLHEEVEEFAGDTAFARLWRGFTTARMSTALVLVVLLGTLHTLAPTLNVSLWEVGLCASYLFATVAVRVLVRPPLPGHAFDPQWVSTIGVDLTAFAALQLLQPGGINYSPLFALPVLTAAVLGSTTLALATAAASALVLLTDAWVQSLYAPLELASRFLQGGLTGTGYFALAFVVSLLAARLAREQQAARHGRRAARAHAQVNELVIESLSEGVLVVDMQGYVHAANPAARMLLGSVDADDKEPFTLHAQPGWRPLGELAAGTFDQRRPLWREMALDNEGASARRIHVRTRLTAPEESQSEGLCVMFLQDLREMEAHLRTEKLAAMGRMSAAVAHEIRNPLAAIAQANDLMDEDLKEPGLRQLSSLVRKNVHRLQQIVEEILDVSRARHGDGAGSALLQLDAAVSSACNDWAMQTRSSSRLRLAPGAPGVQVRFDADHLRRVLVNLLDNALRYAGEQPDSIRVFTRMTQGQASLHIWSDGRPLDPSVQRHLFEPFFSSESRSSGLGLYICRELCERHGAAMGYERGVSSAAGDAREGNEFFVLFARSDSSLAARAAFARIPA